ncbi:MAG TPA: P-loop NTPase [Dehalococcoidia bacterium]|jgi:pilus assembly protein CpaE|nr:P-loop NTPase [Dehalococcoidia bacterium]
MARNPEIVTIDPDLGSRAETKRAVQLAHFSVIGEAGYGVEAVTVAKEHTPDVFLVAFEEPVALAVQTIEALADAAPAVPTIAYSSLADAGSVRRAMVAGARDFLIKPLKPEDLGRAVYGVLEQEERKRLRAGGQAAESAARGTVITIFGAKGGIGKTTISTNLATTLAKITGANVCLLDMDTRFGDVAIMMDIAVEASIADVARHIDDLDRDKIRDYLVKHHSGVNILPAPLHPTEWRNLTPQHIEKIVEMLAQTHDYVVIDTPGTFNELIATTLELANLILLVTSMDIASIKDTALALEMLRAAGVSEDKVKLTINHSTAANSLREDDVARVLEYEVFWRIPHDLAVSSSTQLGQPIVIAKPYARVSRAIIDLAHTLTGTRQEKRGFLDRFLGRSA